MRVELDGKHWGLPDTEEAQKLVDELYAHHTSMAVLKYLINCAGSRELGLWDRIKEMSIKHRKGGMEDDEEGD